MRGTASTILGAVILVIACAAAFGAETPKGLCTGTNVSFINGTRNAMLQLQVREESSDIWIDVLKDQPLGVLRKTPPLCLPAGKSHEIRAVFQGGSNVDKKKQTLHNRAIYVVTQY